MAQIIPTLDELETIHTLVEKYPHIFPSESSLRWALRFRNDNGLGPAVFKVGHRLLIHRPTFEKWIANRQRAAA